MGIKWIKDIRDWPPKKKQKFSLMLAFFLTLIILIFSILIKSVFREEESRIESKYSPLNRMTDSFVNIFKEAENEAGEIFDEANNRLEQINSTSSSSSIDINIVE